MLKLTMKKIKYDFILLFIKYSQCRRHEALWYRYNV